MGTKNLVTIITSKISRRDRLGFAINKNKFIGDRKFYKGVLVLAIPIIIQQLITSFVNMLDNIMVGQTGTYAMSAVSVANQLITVFSLAIFGLVSAASIFAAQYAGKKDYRNVQNCLYFDVALSFVVSSISIVVFWVFGEKLLYLFMNPNTDSEKNIAITMQYALNYLRIMTVGFIPFAFSQSISSSMRVNGETRLPMVTSIVTVFVNFVFNLVLIFGLVGFPAMGPKGAAIATVISRFVELSMFIYFANKTKYKFEFYSGFFENFHIDFKLFEKITIAGIPLIVNEVLYSLGITAITQSYSTRGIEALAAYNISQTIIGLFIVFNLAMGDCISIMVGRLLGRYEIEEAVDTDRKLIVFSFILAVFVGTVLVILAPLFPGFYNTTEDVKIMAANMLRVGGAFLWISAVYNASYYTLRSGGKTIITLVFDSVGIVLISYPVSFLLAKFTGFDIVTMYLIITAIDFYKIILGLFLVNKRIWVKNLAK